MRRIISFFVESSKRSLREPFFRLNQISSLLQLEKVSEMTEYWNDGDGEVWLLSVDEVKNVLHCRPDFDSQEIESLKLPQN